MSSNVPLGLLNPLELHSHLTNIQLHTIETSVHLIILIIAKYGQNNGCLDAAANAEHKNHDNGKQKVTHLQFYMHDVVLGKNAIAVQGVPQNPVNTSARVPFYGSVYVIDEPLTEILHHKLMLLGVY
ncbi:hypothetical protein SUGI_0136330 [Cryptomeria japonica]|nr:hypothetical protein SUGI_0136330 [Cryptomeria japonica]